MGIKKVGDGKVVLISGGGRVLTDIAARFVGSERGLDAILASDYDKNIVRNIVASGHKAATEFDYFVFGVEGYARVTEVQLVRKRLASYIIKSGRTNKKGNRSFDIVLPDDIKSLGLRYKISLNMLELESGEKLGDYLKGAENNILNSVFLRLTTVDILDVLEKWYAEGVFKGLAEENLRYMKPQGTEFKAIIGMNAHALLDWFQIRCCLNAQFEIRDLANKMLALCKEVSPDLFKGAGASCKVMGYCPENGYQNKKCRGKVITKDDAIKILNGYNDI